jgi:hypothetical protein
MSDINMKKNYFNRMLFPALLLVLAILYKGYEWTQLTNLNNFQRKAEIQELSFINSRLDEDDAGDDVSDDFFISLESSTSSEISQQADLVIDELILVRERDRKYLNLIEENKNEFKKLGNKSKFLFGKNGEFIKDYVLLATDYYSEEIENINSNIVAAGYYENLILVLRDSAIIDNFTIDNFSGDLDEELISDNFSDIASIEKYTRSDFKFETGEDGEPLVPYFLEFLNDYQIYFKNFYLLVKDVAIGDMESASYKYEAAMRQRADTNFDFYKLDRDISNIQFETGKKVLTASSNKLKHLYSYSDLNLGRFPFLAKIEQWETRLVECNLLWFQTGHYFSFKDEYPEELDIIEFTNSLNGVPASLDDLRKNIDFENIKFTNDEDEISFECSPNTDESLDFDFYVKKQKEE